MECAASYDETNDLQTLEQDLPHNNFGSSFLTDVEHTTHAFLE